MPRKKIPVELQEQIDAQRTKIKKPRKKRKPMTTEQKAAAVERLAKARAAKGPAKNSSINEAIRDIPDDDIFSAKNAKESLKYNQELLKSIKSLKDSKDAKDRDYYNTISSYVDNLKKYISTGIYLDNRYGNERQGKVSYRCVAMAYYKDGTPKRSVGTWYPDVGTWTQEMENE